MGVERPAKRTVMPPEQVFVALATAWKLITKTEPDRKTIHIFHAQSAIETGHWQKMMNFNLGGIKKHGDCDWTYFSTGEVWPDAKAKQELASSKPGAEVKLIAQKDGNSTLLYSGKQPMTCFASWDGLNDGAAGYIGLLANRFPKAIEAAKKGDHVSYVRELKRGKYFTGPEQAYADMMGSIVRSYTKKLADVQIPSVVVL